MSDRCLVGIYYLVAFPLAVILLATSLMVHLITFWPINIQDRIPIVFLLHIGIFVLFIPLVFIDRVLVKGPSMAGLGVAKTQPVWMWICYGFIGVYVVFNFLFFLIAGGGNPESEGGKYWLKNHGEVVRELTRQEYDRESARILHGFSGHWLFFYLYIVNASFLGIKSFKRQGLTELK